MKTIRYESNDSDNIDGYHDLVEIMIMTTRIMGKEIITKTKVV